MSNLFEMFEPGAEYLLLMVKGVSGQLTEVCESRILD